MKILSFKNTHHLGKVVFENELYMHVHHPDMLLAYDSNYLEFKRTPTRDEFLVAEAYLRSFHIKNDQNHVKYYFPENEIPATDLLAHFTDQNYHVGILELYAIQPDQFPSVTDSPEITIKAVTIQNLETYLEFQYELDLMYGAGYAEQRHGQHKRNFQNERFMQLLAYYQGLPAGSLDIIISNEITEIDRLIVLESFQKKGIGSRMQKYVMDHFYDQTVILVANGEDTAREMYKRQNYQYLGFTYEVMKVFEF